MLLVPRSEASNVWITLVLLVRASDGADVDGEATTALRFAADRAVAMQEGMGVG